ncbi:hypothetical protein Leryth_010574 [Lithospermum erythrorhizon]|nr:hypothetical protein Leryth_010574 [Lithospermum erythrorhizon]
MRLARSARSLVDMMEKLIMSEDMASEDVSLAPFIEMDMSKSGQLVQAREAEASKSGISKRQGAVSSQKHGANVLRMFSVGAADGGGILYAELCLQEDGVLTLSTSNSSSLSFSGLEIEEGRWHHLAVVHNKPNALAGLFQARGAVSRVPSCTSLERIIKGLFQDLGLWFVPNQACGGGSMAILDSLDAEFPTTSNSQKAEIAGKQGTLKVDRSGFVWDLEKLGNLSLQLAGKKLIFAFDGTSTELFRTSGTLSMLNLVDPVSAAASPIGGIPRFGRLIGDTYVSSQTSSEDLNLSKFHDEYSSVESHGDLDDSSAPKDSFSHISELENTDMLTETSNCIVLSNPDMVEHVLLDWTLWVVSPIPIQISLLGFLEHLVSMHWYRYHNLTILRRINLVQHLLVTLQRGDVEVPVLEKLVILLGVILEDGFLPSELEHVVRFVIMTFDPPELISHHQIKRESMGKHVIVRNMLLEMLIDLQVTIRSEELLEQWHKVVSSKLITYFLDEALHPTSMRWVMTLLGVCLASSPTFAHNFRSSGRYQGLVRVLPSFYDSPDIYYILFCLMFGKPVYPRLPEVRLLDFHALMPSDGNYKDLKFVELLESVIAMTKSTFDRLCMQSVLAHQTGNLSQVGVSLEAELVEGNADMGGDLLGEALMHKTYAARLMGGEAAAPSAATSVLRFMVDLGKMCSPFSAACRRPEFLESCIDLYFSCVRAANAVKLARALSVKAEDKNLNDADDNHSSQNTFSSMPQEEEQSAKTSVSMGSFPPAHVSSSSEEISVASNVAAGEKTELNPSWSEQNMSKSMQEDAQIIPSLAGETTEQNSMTSSHELDLNDVRNTPNNVYQSGSQSSTSLTMQDSPMLSERSDSRISLPSASSPVLALTSWLGGSSHSESRVQFASSPPLESSPSPTENDPSADLKSGSQWQHAANALFAICPTLLLEVDDSGYGGGPCSAGATAVLDFMAEVLSGLVTEQMKSVPVIETILESVPLFVDAESVLVFQGLCLGRLINFLEGRLLRDDEEGVKKLDKTRWSLNLDALCYMIVDRVYMGAFPRPSAVLKTLEFLLSMLHLENRDGRIEEAAPAGKGILSIGRGSRQLDTYIYAIFKNMNRMILFCFLPSFLVSIGEDDIVSRVGLQIESRKGSSLNSTVDERGVDVSTVLQLLVSHRRLIFCPSNHDTDINCCLCSNLIALLSDQRSNVQNMAVEILKYLLLHRRRALEDLLVSKPNQGPPLDVLHRGFDKLLTGNMSNFFEWLQSSEQKVNQVLGQCASIMWVQYITGSTKFPGVRIKGMDTRRKREIGRKLRETSKLEPKHWEHVNERRIALEVIRDAITTELRVVRQDKYGWVLHAESEWQSHLQELVHERGILPMNRSSTSEEPEWQLCPIEGPYRMRKKLERCKLKIDTVQNVLNDNFKIEDLELPKEKAENELEGSDTGSDHFFNLLNENSKQDSFNTEQYDESIIKESNDIRDAASSRAGWNEDQSSINEASLHSAADFGVDTSIASSQKAESVQDKSDIESPRPSSSTKVDDIRLSEDKSEKELNDNGEYLIRPYLKPLEKIKYKYNCERVVGLDKHDGMFLIGELSLYVIENFYIDDSGCICEKESIDDLSIIDQALGVKKDMSGSMDSHFKSTSSLGAAIRTCVGGRAWAYSGGAWGKEKVSTSGNVPHLWHMWKLNSIHEILKRDYQLRPVAIEIFSMDGCNDLLVFHKKEREEVFKNLVAMNLPRNSMLDTTISGSVKQETNEGSRLFKVMAKSFSKRWQNGEISNFQYLMHLNTLAGRGYSDLTQYPVFPWVLADYESENLDLKDPKTFRKLDKPMGCQTLEGEEEFRKRYESWDDPDVPKFHYGSHYSSAGIVLFYLLRLPPFSVENQKLQGGQFDHADRLFNSVRDTWLSASGKGNTSDVKELIPEFFYMSEFLENSFNLDLGEKQSGEKVGDVVLPRWAKGSAREFIRKHREALESDYVSENLHHWIDLIFGYRQRGKAAEEAVNVFYHYTYEGSVDIDSVLDPAMKASILAQINHFGQTPKQLFLKPHPRRRSDRKLPPHPLKHSLYLVPHEKPKASSSISQIVYLNDRIVLVGPNNLLKPKTYIKYIAWGFPDLSLRFMSYNQDKLLSTHENLHGGNQIQCVGASHDGQILVTGADDGLLCVWRIGKDGPRAIRRLHLEKALCAHTAKINCLHVSQPYMMIVSGSDDCTVILWDLSSMVFVRQLPEFPSPVSAIYVNDLTGEIVTAAGVMLAVWSINADCLAVVNTSQLPSDFIVSLTGCTFSDWMEASWYVSGHKSGAIKVWKMIHCSSEECSQSKPVASLTGGLNLGVKVPEYRLILHKVLKFHKHSVTALHLTNDQKQLLSGDAGGNLITDCGSLVSSSTGFHPSASAKEGNVNVSCTYNRKSAITWSQVTNCECCMEGISLTIVEGLQSKTARSSGCKCLGAMLVRVSLCDSLETAFANGYDITNLSNLFPVLLSSSKTLNVPIMEWAYVNRMWDKWASNSVGASDHPLKAAFLMNYDPNGPSRSVSTIAHQEGLTMDPIELSEFVNFVKRNKLQTETFFIGQNQYLVTSIHESWFHARCINTPKAVGEGVIVMQTAAFLLVGMYEGSIGSASQAMVAVDQFSYQLSRKSL